MFPDDDWRHVLSCHLLSLLAHLREKKFEKLFHFKNDCVYVCISVPYMYIYMSNKKSGYCKLICKSIRDNSTLYIIQITLSDPVTCKPLSDIWIKTMV